MLKATERFSDRVTNYLKYRPSYPAELIDTLITECKLSPQSGVADIGSGTGKLSELLLARNLCVSCVEPNKEMREASEALLDTYDGFKSIVGQAEATGLADSSIDLITAAQAYHWFDVDSSRTEFGRILKPDGRIALIWNQRDIGHSFQREYDEMLKRYAPEYSGVNHRNVKDSDIEEFYHPYQMKKFSFLYDQKFDLVSLLGRMQSSSYTPKDGTPESDSLVSAAEELFSRHECNGAVEFSYQTNLYLSVGIGTT